MDIRQNKTNNVTPVFKSICDTFSTYIPAMHVKGEDTFVSTRKDQQMKQNPTKEQLLSRLKKVDIPEEAKAQIEEYAKEDFQIVQAYKLLSDPRLYKNPNILDSIYSILYTAYKNNSESRNSLIDKYLSTSDLYDNELISSKIGVLIGFATNPNTAWMADKILSTPELYSSEEFTQNIDELNCISNGLDKEKILDKFLKREALYKNKEMQSFIIDYIKAPKNGAQEKFACKVFDYVEQGIVSPQLAIQLVKYSEFQIEPENLQKLKDAIEPNIYSELSLNRNDIIVASRVIPLYNKSSITEVPKEQRNQALKGIIKSNNKLFGTTDILKKYFPLIPQSKEEYCALLPQLATSIGIETKPLTSVQIDDLFIGLNELSSTIAELSDDEFEKLEFSQKYSTNKFIADVLSVIEELPDNEKLKVFDYFGFELKANEKMPNGYYLIGYPINIESPEKLAQITEEKTKMCIQSLSKNVIEYSEKNSITSNNETIGLLLNGIQKAFPEIHTMISGEQGKVRSDETLKHSLKVMQKLAQHPQFENLNNSDKRVLLLTSLFHNIRKIDVASESTDSEDSYKGIERYFKRAFRHKKDSWYREQEAYNELIDEIEGIKQKQIQSKNQAKKYNLVSRHLMHTLSLRNLIYQIPNKENYIH